MIDVLTLGTATQDVFLQSNFFKILRDPKHLAHLGFTTGEAQCFAFGAKLDLNTQPFITIGGGAANAAVTFARQGLHSSAIIKIGDDDTGKNIVRTLHTEHVVPHAVIAKTGTGYSTILLNENGERTVLVYRGASDVFTEKEIPFSKFHAAWLYIVPSHIPLSLMQKIVTYAKKNGIKIALNPSGYYIKEGLERVKPILEHCDVLLMNREEASRFTEISYNAETKIFKKLDAIMGGIVVMTDGARGAIASDGRNMYRAGIFKEKKCVDRTGAGDAFGSGFVAGLIAKNDIHYALRMASANATSVVEYIGAQTGILTTKAFKDARFKYLDLDVEPL